MSSWTHSFLSLHLEKNTFSTLTFKNISVQVQFGFHTPTQRGVNSDPIFRNVSWLWIKRRGGWKVSIKTFLSPLCFPEIKTSFKLVFFSKWSKSKSQFVTFSIFLNQDKQQKQKFKHTHNNNNNKNNFKKKVARHFSLSVNDKICFSSGQNLPHPKFRMECWIY